MVVASHASLRVVDANPGWGKGRARMSLGEPICDDKGMPLSDEEERVLAEIERQLSTEHVGTRSRRFDELETGPSLVGPVLLAVGSLAMTVVGFVAHVGVGLIGFVSLLLSIVSLVRAFGSSYIND